MLHFAVALLLPTCLLLADAFGQKNDSSVAIIDAGVQSSEDAPFVSPAFRFFAGDFVFATFRITNFATKRANAEALPKVLLQYSATLQDGTGLPIAPPATGVIDEELSTEDKNWTPKRRVTFTLPAFLAAGSAQLQIVVKDLVAKTESSRLVPFKIGGVAVLDFSSLAVQNFGFLRRETDAEALDVPSFTPGDTVFAKFNVTGFKVDAQNTYRIVYDVLVLGPDGKPYIQQPHAAELTSNSFYPAQYLPAQLELTTSKNSRKGIYPVLVTVHDLIGNVTIQSKTNFSLE